jgi:quercetin dioxygenase-like cupin family protein
MDQELGSGAITQGIVTIEPGKQSRPHTHRVEESMTLLEGRLRVLIGTEIAEVDAPATFLAPANTVHSLRNVGSAPAVLCIAYPSVNVGTYFVDGIEY